MEASKPPVTNEFLERLASGAGPLIMSTEQVAAMAHELLAARARQDATVLAQADDASGRLYAEYGLAALALNHAKVPLAQDGQQLAMVDRISWLLRRDSKARNALKQIADHDGGDYLKSGPREHYVNEWTQAAGFRACQEIARQALGGGHPTPRRAWPPRATRISPCAKSRMSTASRSS